MQAIILFVSTAVVIIGRKFRETSAAKGGSCSFSFELMC